MLKEIYVNIEGTNGAYSISNHGNVKNNSRNRVLKPWDNGKGYMYVCLSGRKRTSVHRLVAIHFLEKGEGKTEVNHINGVKSDNYVENLEWVTPSENGYHRQAMLDVHREAKYKLVSPDGELHEVVNLAKFSVSLGFHKNRLQMLFCGKAKSYKGWRKAD